MAWKYPRNLHTQPVAPPTTRRSIHSLGTTAAFPKLYIISEPPPKGEIIMLARRKMSTMAFMIHQIEEVGAVLQLPATFRSMTATTPFGEFKAIQGVLITNVQEEIALYQELIMQLAVEEYLEPERTAKKFDQISKLVTLANGTNQRGEREASLYRAVQMAKNLIREEKQI